MRSVTRFLMLGAMALVALSDASAHVTVSPRTSQLGAYEKYTVRVPTEGSVATTSVELLLPDGVTFIAIAAAIGHSYTLKKSDGRVVAIHWAMTIKPSEFAEFSFLGRNPKDGNELVWKAIQHFEDGTSTQWIGPSGDKRPASVTRLSAGEAGHAH